MSKEDGGPAFPVSYDHQTFEPRHVDEAKRLMSGMTLRDYFAAQALATLQAYPVEDVQHYDAFDIASHAYAVADAMLAARVKP